MGCYKAKTHRLSYIVLLKCTFIEIMKNPNDIPKSVTSIGDGPFSDCSALEIVKNMYDIK